MKDGKEESVSREPEVVRAFRDTWKDGIHSYLSYLRERLTVARDLLADSGSVFVQIGDENVHVVRSLMDEVFGQSNFVSIITVSKTSGSTQQFLPSVSDFIIWYGKDKDRVKYRPLFLTKTAGGQGGEAYQFVQLQDGTRLRASKSLPQGVDTADIRYFRLSDMTSQSVGREKGEGASSWFGVEIAGRLIKPSEKVRWKTNEVGMDRLKKANRIEPGKNTLNYVRFIDDFPAFGINNVWADVGSSVGGEKLYVVQTSNKIVERCVLLTTEPGDLVLDPTCGSGTTAYVAEQWAGAGSQSTLAVWR